MSGSSLMVLMRLVSSPSCIYEKRQHVQGPNIYIYIYIYVQVTTGPTTLLGPPSRGQQRGEGIVMNPGDLVHGVPYSIEYVWSTSWPVKRPLTVRCSENIDSAWGLSSATFQAARGKWYTPRGTARYKKCIVLWHGIEAWICRSFNCRWLH